MTLRLLTKNLCENFELSVRLVKHTEQLHEHLIRKEMASAVLWLIISSSQICSLAQRETNGQYDVCENY